MAKVLSVETVTPSSCKYKMLAVLRLVMVIWFPCENLAKPKAIETPRFPPPIMCTFMYWFFSSPQLPLKEGECVGFYYFLESQH